MSLLRHFLLRGFFFQLLTEVVRFCYPLLTIFLCFYSSFLYSSPVCLNLCFSRRLFSLYLFDFTNKTKSKSKKKQSNDETIWICFGRGKCPHSWISLCRYEILFGFLLLVLGSQISSSPYNIGTLIKPMKMIPICRKFDSLFMIIARERKRKRERENIKEIIRKKPNRNEPTNQYNKQTNVQSGGFFLVVHSHSEF